MTSSANGPRRFAAIAGILAWILVAGPAVSGGERTALEIQSALLDGDRFVISVVNPGEKTAHGALTVFVARDGGVVETRYRLTVPGGETTRIELASPAPGEEMTPLGVILDDGSPF